jgi:hypothetical protein
MVESTGAELIDNKIYELLLNNVATKIIDGIDKLNTP